MTDQIPADEVREIIGKMRYHADHDNVLGTEEEYIRFFAGQLAELLPAPTLADMTPAARRDCQWMQCEVNGKRRIITLIIDDSDHNYAVTLDSSGYIFRCPFESVTPRPDLPCMSWPVPDLNVEDANTVKVGDVIQSAADPRLSALPTYSALADREGDVVVKGEKMWAGDGYTPIPAEGGEFGPWKVLHIAQEDDQ